MFKAMEKNENERNDFMRILKPLSLKTSLSSDFGKVKILTINHHHFKTKKIFIPL